MMALRTCILKINKISCDSDSTLTRCCKQNHPMMRERRYISRDSRQASYEVHVYPACLYTAIAGDSMHSCSSTGRPDSDVIRSLLQSILKDDRKINGMARQISSGRKVSRPLEPSQLRLNILGVLPPDQRQALAWMDEQGKLAEATSLHLKQGHRPAEPGAASMLCPYQVFVPREYRACMRIRSVTAA